MTADLREQVARIILATDTGDSAWRTDSAYDAATAILAAIQQEGWAVVPKRLTEDMAAAMECQFSTEAQWEAALQAAPKIGEGRS